MATQHEVLTPDAAGDGDGDARIARWIEANPYRPGVANARVRDYGVPVWALVGHAAATGRPVAELAADYAIPVEAAEAALAFYRRHTAVIDARIAANAA
jgi:uncharacterized protein (DUF433 family)